jgi:hypothetical protein
MRLQFLQDTVLQGCFKILSFNPIGVGVSEKKKSYYQMYWGQICLEVATSFIIPQGKNRKKHSLNISTGHIFFRNAILSNLL